MANKEGLAQQPRPAQQPHLAQQHRLLDAALDQAEALVEIDAALLDQVFFQPGEEMVGAFDRFLGDADALLGLQLLDQGLNVFGRREIRRPKKLPSSAATAA